MATSNEASRIAADPQWQGRVDVYAHSSAVLTLSEAQDNGGQTVATWQKRQDYARAVLSGEGRIAEYSIAVFNNSTVLAGADINQPVNGGYNVPDGDLQFAVNEQFNAMSGVDAADRASP